MVAVFLLIMRDRDLTGVLAGVLASGPLYLAFGFVLAKFGYQRKTLKEMRAETPKKSSSKADKAKSDDDEQPAGPRPKPPPTKRTGGGQRQRPKSRKSR